MVFLKPPALPEVTHYQPFADSYYPNPTFMVYTAHGTYFTKQINKVKKPDLSAK